MITYSRSFYCIYSTLCSLYNFFHDFTTCIEITIRWCKFDQLYELQIWVQLCIDLGSNSKLLICPITDLFVTLLQQIILICITYSTNLLYCGLKWTLIWYMVRLYHLFNKFVVLWYEMDFNTIYMVSFYRLLNKLVI